LNQNCEIRVRDVNQKEAWIVGGEYYCPPIVDRVGMYRFMYMITAEDLAIRYCVLDEFEMVFKGIDVPYDFNILENCHSVIPATPQANFSIRHPAKKDLGVRVHEIVNRYCRCQK
jgi:hypothetical protein